MQSIILKGLKTNVSTEDLMFAAATWLKYDGKGRSHNLIEFLDFFPTVQYEVLYGVFLEGMDYEHKTYFFEPWTKFLINALARKPTSINSTTTAVNGLAQP